MLEESASGIKKAIMVIGIFLIAICYLFFSVAIKKVWDAQYRNGIYHQPFCGKIDESGLTLLGEIDGCDVYMYNMDDLSYVTYKGNRKPMEHLRHDIDMAMYGFDTAKYKNIFAANYKLAVDTSNGKKLYTFCMCPGGEVVPSASSEKSICTNGMSYRGRDGINSNAALLIPFDPKSIDDNPLTGMIYQDILEKNAYRISGSTGKAPYMTYGDLKNGTSGSEASVVKPTYSPGAIPCDFRELLPEYMIDTLIEGIALMGKKIKGFDSDSAVLTAVETRSSSPVRIPRDKDSYEHITVNGLYPAGEGAGYAGGIMSSAIDGIKCANRLAESMLL